jgi:hypothetical protein
MLAIDFDGFYETRSADSRCEAARSGPILALSTDGKGIVMRPESLREATRKAAEKRAHKMSKRLSRGEKRNCKRMAQVATVFTIAAFVRKPEDIVSDLRPVRDTNATVARPRPENKRVWASVAKLSCSAWHTCTACVGVLALFLRGCWTLLASCPRAYLRRTLDQSRAPSLQRVVLHAFTGTTSPSDSLSAPRPFRRCLIGRGFAPTSGCRGGSLLFHIEPSFRAVPSTPGSSSATSGLFALSLAFAPT